MPKIIPRHLFQVWLKEHKVSAKMFDSAVKDEAPKKGLLSRWFGMFDIFKESEHPRDKTGKFTDKNSGNEIAEKTYIHYKPIKDIIKSIKKYMGKPDGTYNMATGELKNYTTQTTNAQKIPREIKRYKHYRLSYRAQR